MRKMVTGILRQYGTAVLLCRETEEVRIRGFFQPVRSKSWQSIVSAASALGESPRRQYVFIGPAEPQAREGDTLRLGDREYSIRRAEPYCYGDETVYIWCLCVEKGEDGPWEK